MPPAGHAAAMRNLKALGDAFFAAPSSHANQSSQGNQSNQLLTKAAQRARDELAIRVPTTIRAAHAIALDVNIAEYPDTANQDNAYPPIAREERATLSAARSAVDAVFGQQQSRQIDAPGSSGWRECVRALLQAEAHLAQARQRCLGAARHLAGGLPRNHPAVIQSQRPGGVIGPAEDANAQGGGRGAGGDGSSAGVGGDAKRKRSDEGELSAPGLAPSVGSTGSGAGEAPLPKRARTGSAGPSAVPGIVSIRTNALSVAQPLQKGSIIAARLGDPKKRKGSGRGSAGRRGRASGAKGDDAEGAAASDAGDEDCEWIIGSVVRFLSSGDYEIEDVDADADSLAAAARGGTSTSAATTGAAGARKRHILAPRRIVQLPAFPRGTVKLAAGWYVEIPVGTEVWAVFPHTTSFYPGVVTGVPSTNEENPDAYRVRFQDDEDEYGGTPDRNVHAQYVFAAR